MISTRINNFAGMRLSSRTSNAVHAPKHPCCPRPAFDRMHDRASCLSEAPKGKFSNARLVWHMPFWSPMMSSRITDPLLQPGRHSVAYCVSADPRLSSGSSIVLCFVVPREVLSSSFVCCSRSMSISKIVSSPLTISQYRCMTLRPDVRIAQATSLRWLQVAIPRRAALQGIRLARPQRDEADRLARRVGVSDVFIVGSACVHARVDIRGEERQQRIARSVLVAVDRKCVVSKHCKFPLAHPRSLRMEVKLLSPKLS